MLWSCKWISSYTPKTNAEMTSGALVWLPAEGVHVGLAGFHRVPIETIFQQGAKYHAEAGKHIACKL